MPEAGLYLHIPFCEKKCAYCDFYTAVQTDALLERYVAALIAEIKRWGGSFGRPIGSIYLGGGTPSLLGKHIVPLLEAARESFQVYPNAEITAEMNPSNAPEPFLNAAHSAGVNRLSLGVQSGNDARLSFLGRTHTAADVCKTVAVARAVGFQNISVDLMLGFPEETEDELTADIDFALSLGVEHLSAYLLKIEPNTRFAMEGISPDEDTQAELYLTLCARMRQNGFHHYEISNFARYGFEGQHNLKYWRCEEYLGIGASAHSFLGGERFYYPRDLHAFLKAPAIIKDTCGGDISEQIMLALRLDSGYDFAEHRSVLPFLKQLEQADYGALCETRFALNDKGMLLSNQIITEILERIV